jgi:proline dehydrogenase
VPLARSVFLAASNSAYLREHATRFGFVRRSVRRFMPGERLEDALGAAEELRAQRIPTLVTRLGENITEVAQADETAAHYLDVLERVRAAALDAQVSVKLTQLGLDQDVDLCHRHVARLAHRAQAVGAGTLWIDMEGSDYVDRTLDVYRRLRSAGAAVGIAIQAYLRRTPADVESLLPLGPSIRLVKGAYREPPAVAFPDKRDVDEAYFRLAEVLLSPGARATGTFAAFGTHDTALIRRLQDAVARVQAPAGSYEYEMLYGIQRGEQQRLAGAGQPLRVLISYGDYWFPWYMRRLAERPANVWFVVKNLWA